MSNARNESPNNAPNDFPNDSGIVVAPVSMGELIDKITILRIKAARIPNPDRLKNVRHELNLLQRTLAESVRSSDTLDHLTVELQHVNELLWDVEDNIRLCDRDGDFGPRFVELARAVYRHNDHRCAIKRQINEMLNSSLVEEKSYQVEAKK